MDLSLPSQCTVFTEYELIIDVSSILSNRELMSISTISKTTSNPESVPAQEPVKNTRLRITAMKEIVAMNVTDLVVTSNSCNDVVSLCLDQYKCLKSIEIGDDCFMNVNIFNIDGLNELKSIKIGSNSFTLVKSTDNWDRDKANNNNRSFHLLNCIELESIEIDEFSFSDYGGEFELKNLPKLNSIRMGMNGGMSYNFCYASFVAKGISKSDMMNIDLPNLATISLNKWAFCYTLSTVISSIL